LPYKGAVFGLALLPATCPGRLAARNLIRLHNPGGA
jgi:hypothetical protein